MFVCAILSVLVPFASFFVLFLKNQKLCEKGKTRMEFVLLYRIYNVFFSKKIKLGDAKV